MDVTAAMARQKAQQALKPESAPEGQPTGLAGLSCTIAPSGRLPGQFETPALDPGASSKSLPLTSQDVIAGLDVPMGGQVTFEPPHRYGARRKPRMLHVVKGDAAARL